MPPVVPRRNSRGSLRFTGRVMTETKQSAFSHVKFVQIPASHRESGVPGIEFTVSEGVEVVGLVLMAPGSGGGLGPGLEKAPQPFSHAFDRSTYGGMYMRLGHELATGEEFSWEYKKVRKATSAVDDTNNWNPRHYQRSNSGVGFGCNYSTNDRTQNTSAPAPTGRPDSLHRLGQITKKPTPQRGVVSLMIDWSKIPRGKLRRLDMLQSAVSDVNAAAQWLTAKYPAKPLVLLGFSFGGPSMWAATRQLPTDTPIAGAASIAGSARGGSVFTKLKLDTEGCVKAFAERNCHQYGKDCCATNETDRRSAAPATLFLHGTHDELVALQVAEYLYSHASQPKSLVRINWATHMFNTARDSGYNNLKTWVLAAFERWRNLQVACLRSTDQSTNNATASRTLSTSRSTICPHSQHVGVSLSSETSIGPPLRQEGFVVKPSKSRRRRACSANHALSGLVGYSGLSSDSEED